MLDNFLANAAGVAKQVRALDRLVTGANGVGAVAARLDFSPRLDGCRGELGSDLVDVLLDHASLARSKEAVFNT